MEDRIIRTIKFPSDAVTRKIVDLLVVGMLLAGLSYGQAVQSQDRKSAYGADMGKVPEAIAKLKSGEFGSIHVDLIARAMAVEAIPVLKEQFVRNQDELLKGKTAGALLRLGDKEDVYWDYLLKLASPALESDAPDFMSYDVEGKPVRGPSPEFIAWAKETQRGPQRPRWYSGGGFRLCLSGQSTVAGVEWRRESHPIASAGANIPESHD